MPELLSGINGIIYLRTYLRTYAVIYAKTNVTIYARSYARSVARSYPRNYAISRSKIHVRRHFRIVPQGAKDVFCLKHRFERRCVF